MSGPASTISTIIPCLRYRDPRAAIDWLVRAFGFVAQAVHHDAQGRVVHAQLTFGNGMVMLGPTGEDGFGQYLMQPEEIGGRETQCPCVIVADCRSHYRRAMAEGAAIVDEYAEKDYGGAGYSCRDPEGHLWWFGSYDPWKDS